MSGGDVLVSHPTLNQNVREAALALAEAGRLAELHTSLAVGPRLTAVGGLHPRLGRLLGRRAVPPGTAAVARSHPGYELRRALARRVPRLDSPLGHPTLHGMYAHFDALTARRVHAGLGAVLAYEDGALQTFAAASRAGLPRVYDLPIPYWRMKHDLLEEEAARNPAWAPLLGGLDDPDWVIDRKTGELAAADLVLSASTLSTASIRQASPGSTVVQVAYGCPPPAPTIRPSADGPLRALYVGSLTQRKGLSYLFEAMRVLGPSAELTVVGSGPVAESDVLRRALEPHRHIPSVPHQHMSAMMRRHDVLVLPSLVEGFGLVITEALSQGLPVVATDRTGLVDLLGDPQHPWLVPASDAAAIANRLALWAGDRDRLDGAKEEALEVARRNPWTGYREGFRQAVLPLLG